jgi:hypothetical protein
MKFWSLHMNSGSNKGSKHDEMRRKLAPEHETYEHEDWVPANVMYFLLALAVATVIAIVVLRGVYAFLDHRERASQPPVSPLVQNVPEDTRHVAPGYSQAVFPSPRLEEDERGQLNGIRMQEENTLYSYGWVDEKAGTVRIPIDRAMDLLVQRGLPVHSPGTASQTAGAPDKKQASKTASGEMPAAQ